MSDLVNTGDALSEQMFSALRREAEAAADIREVAFVPKAGIPRSHQRLLSQPRNVFE
jgi:hypothetical protein